VVFDGGYALTHPLAGSSGGAIGADRENEKDRQREDKRQQREAQREQQRQAEQQNRERLRTMLTTTIDDPLAYVQEVILKEAKQEDRLVKQLLYVMLSAKTNNPMNLAINAPTGEGKNWVLEKVASLFPKGDVIKLQGMTDKAIFHETGDIVIQATDIDFGSFELELDELGELDKYGYYKYDYVTDQIDLQLDEIVERDSDYSSETMGKQNKRLAKEVEAEKKHLAHFAKKLINLEHKIMLFLDTPSMSFISALMPLLSHDSYESEYKYVDTNAGIKTYKNLLRGWPSMIFAQAIDYSKYERWPEVQRRFIITNPTMDSKKKIEEAIHLIVQKHCLPDFMYQKLVVSDDEKQKAREIIEYLSDKILQCCKNLKPGSNNTFVPYQEAIDSVLTKEQTSDMTAAKRFNAFLSLLPMINITKRPSIRMQKEGEKEDEDGPIVYTMPLGTFEDLNDALYIMQFSNGVRPYVLQWYYDIFLPLYNEQTVPASKVKRVSKEDQIIHENRIAVTTIQLIKATKEKRHKSYTSKQLLESFIYPLMNQGYIDLIDSEIDHRSKINFPARESEAAGSENENQNIFFMAESVKTNKSLENSKINLRDLTLFPSREYVMSKIEGVLKYSSETGVHVKIFDHEDKEIQLEELVEFYYHNPENYFRYPQSEPEENTVMQDIPADEYFQKGQNRGVSQENSKQDVKPMNSEDQYSNKLFVEPKNEQRIYFD
jgi:hypothetical protein